jgi:hypothetical protein
LYAFPIFPCQTALFASSYKMLMIFWSASMRTLRRSYTIYRGRRVSRLQDSDIDALLQANLTALGCGYLGDVILKVSNYQPTGSRPPRLMKISITERQKLAIKKIYFG